MVLLMGRILEYNNSSLINKKSTLMYINKNLSSIGIELIGNYHRKVRRELLRANKKAIKKLKEGHQFFGFGSERGKSSLKMVPPKKARQKIIGLWI